MQHTSRLSRTQGQAPRCAPFSRLYAHSLQEGVARNAGRNRRYARAVRQQHRTLKHPTPTDPSSDGSDPSNDGAFSPDPISDGSDPVGNRRLVTRGRKRGADGLTIDHTSQVHHCDY